MKATTKRTIDVPDELYYKIMLYAVESKLYKFSPAVIDLIRKALEEKKEDNGNN